MKRSSSPIDFPLSVFWCLPLCHGHFSHSPLWIIVFMVSSGFLDGQVLLPWSSFQEGDTKILPQPPFCCVCFMHPPWATTVCCRINYYLSGGFHPVGFHVVNILLHGGISILTLDVFSVLFGGLQYTSKGRRVHLAPRASLLAALLFAVHPVHTECVSIPHVRQSACVWDVCVVK